MFKDKSLTDFTSLFSPNNFKDNDRKMFPSRTISYKKYKMVETFTNEDKKKQMMLYNLGLIGLTK